MAGYRTERRPATAQGSHRARRPLPVGNRQRTQTIREDRINETAFAAHLDVRHAMDRSAAQRHRPSPRRDPGRGHRHSAAPSTWVTAARPAPGRPAPAGRGFGPLPAARRPPSSTPTGGMASTATTPAAPQPASIRRTAASRPGGAAAGQARGASSACAAMPLKGSADQRLAVAAWRWPRSWVFIGDEGVYRTQGRLAPPRAGVGQLLRAARRCDLRRRWRCSQARFRRGQPGQRGTRVPNAIPVTGVGGCVAGTAAAAGSPACACATWAAIRWKKPAREKSARPWMANLKAGYRFTPQLQVTLDILNLFAKQATTSNTGAAPAPTARPPAAPAAVAAAAPSTAGWCIRSNRAASVSACAWPF